ncbi:MAG: LacI family DNA-binding transcriptional regulator [Acidimicrobiia bacterium]
MRRQSTRPTIKEVASEAGVSTQTVSRVINERPDVSPTTRQRVQDVIDTLGYRPSALARSLIRQRSHTLGVVTAGLQYLGPTRTLSGIASAAEGAGYSVLLTELPGFHANNTVSIFQGLLSRHVDGIIWAVPQVGDNRGWVDAPPIDAGLPLVYLTMEPGRNVASVSIDNHLGGRLAVSHLLDQGFRRIGHISGPLDWWEARERMAAWKQTLGESGLSVGDNHWAEGNWSSQSGFEAMDRLLTQYPDMDSIFVANDQMALGAMQTITKRGLRIPEDLGIVGFDNVPESAFYSPPLTTIEQDQYSVAKLAVEEMIKVIESNWSGHQLGEPKTLMLEPTLVIRQSSTSREDPLDNAGSVGPEVRDDD